MYVPEMPLEQANALRASDPAACQAQSMQAMARHVEAMLAFRRQGAIVFDYRFSILDLFPENEPLARWIRLAQS